MVVSYERVPVLQVLHLLGVVLGVGRVGPGVPGLGPADLGDASGGDEEAAEPQLAAHLHQDAAGHQLPPGEHGQAAGPGPVQLHGQGSDLPQHHGSDSGLRL